MIIIIRKNKNNNNIRIILQYNKEFIDIFWVKNENKEKAFNKIEKNNNIIIP